MIKTGQATNEESPTGDFEPYRAFSEVTGGFEPPYEALQASA